jgi:hypothetical protein
MGLGDTNCRCSHSRYSHLSGHVRGTTVDLPSKVVFDVLESNNVTKLHHANSVVTSCQFIKQRALLSRGTVETMKLNQTDQYSDEDDKRYSLWFDVFVRPDTRFSPARI